MPAAARVRRGYPKLVIAAVGHNATSAVGPGTVTVFGVRTDAAVDEDLVEHDVRAHTTRSIVKIVGTRRGEAKLPVVAGHETSGSERQCDCAAPLPVKRGIRMDTDSRGAGRAQQVLPGRVGRAGGQADRATTGRRRSRTGRRRWRNDSRGSRQWTGRSARRAR